MTEAAVAPATQATTSATGASQTPAPAASGQAEATDNFSFPEGVDLNAIENQSVLAPESMDFIKKKGYKDLNEVIKSYSEMETRYSPMNSLLDLTNKEKENLQRQVLELNGKLDSMSKTPQKPTAMLPEWIKDPSEAMKMFSENPDDFRAGMEKLISQHNNQKMFEEQMKPYVESLKEVQTQHEKLASDNMAHSNLLTISQDKEFSNLPKGVTVEGLLKHDSLTPALKDFSELMDIAPENIVKAICLSPNLAKVFARAAKSTIINPTYIFKQGMEYAKREAEKKGKTQSTPTPNKTGARPGVNQGPDMNALAAKKLKHLFNKGD